MILQIQIKKFENDCYIMWKIILTENPSRFNVEPLVWKLYSNMYAVHVTVALVGVATLNLALPAPPALHQIWKAALNKWTALVEQTNCGISIWCWIYCCVMLSFYCAVE